MTTNLTTDLPRTPEIEQQVISALLAQPERFSDLAVDLDSDSFSESTYKTVFQAISAATTLNGSGAYDIFTVTDYLQQNNLLDKIGGQKFLLALYSLDTYGNSSLEKHVELLDAYRFKRSLIQAGREIAKLGFDPTKEVEEIIDLAQSNLSNTLDRLSSDRPELVSSLVERIKDYVTKGDSKGISSGLILLDRILGGFKPAKLYILGARTGMGKTNLAVYFALEIAKTNSYPVLFFSAEMSIENLSLRFVASLSGVNSANIARDFMDWDERERYAQGLDKFAQLNLIIDETPANKLDSKAIATKVRSVVKTYGGVAAVFIDYIQLLGAYNVQRRDLAIGEVSRSCKDLAKIYKIPFIVLAQVKREVETRANKRPMLSDLKDSGSLEQDADAIAFIYRDEYYNKCSDTPGVTELIVAKHRDGGTGTISLEHDLGTCSYLEPKTFTLNHRTKF